MTEDERLDGTKFERSQPKKDNIIEIPVSHDCNQVDDNIVSKEDDDILKKWVMIGHHFFSDNVGEIVIPVECCPLTIKTSCDNDLIILQSPHDGLQDEINLGTTIDRADAYRLAGLLIAWASAKHLHTFQHDGNKCVSQPEYKRVDLDGMKKQMTTGSVAFKSNETSAVFTNAIDNVYNRAIDDIKTKYGDLYYQPANKE